MAAGAAVGATSIVLLSAAQRRGWSDGRCEQIATFAVPLVAYSTADALDGSGFIAAFVAGLLFGALVEHGRAELFGEFTEDAAQLLGIAAFFLFGNLFEGEALSTFQPAVWLAAVLSLTIVRFVPVWISLIGTGERWPTRLLRGVGGADGDDRRRARRHVDG